jgi:hypothetical protein
MRKSRSGYLAVALALMLVAVFVFMPSGAGPGALPREMAFWGGLHNSLGQLDDAKRKWAEEKHKSDGDVPTMEDLAPYLGDWTNHIARFVALGVTYKITPISEAEPQSDVATLTRDLRFQIGFCRYYRAGTSFSLHGGHVSPPYDTKSLLIAFYQNNRGLLVIVLFALAVGNLLVFVIKRIQNVRQVSSVTHEHQSA